MNMFCCLLIDENEVSNGIEKLSIENIMTDREAQNSLEVIWKRVEQCGICNEEHLDLLFKLKDFLDTIKESEVKQSTINNFLKY